MNFCAVRAHQWGLEKLLEHLGESQWTSDHLEGAQGRPYTVLVNLESVQRHLGTFPSCQEHPLPLNLRFSPSQRSWNPFQADQGHTWQNFAICIHLGPGESIDA